MSHHQPPMRLGAGQVRTGSMPTFLTRRGPRTCAHGIDFTNLLELVSWQVPLESMRAPEGQHRL